MKISLKKSAQTVEGSLDETINTPEKSPKLFETDDGKAFVNRTFTGLLNLNNPKTYRHWTLQGAVSHERFNTTFSVILENPAFGKSYTNWLDEQNSVTNKYKRTILSSSNLNLI